MSFNISEFEKFANTQFELVTVTHKELADKVCSNIITWHRAHCTEVDSACESKFMKAVLIYVVQKENTALHKVVNDMMRNKV